MEWWVCFYVKKRILWIRVYPFDCKFQSDYNPSQTIFADLVRRCAMLEYFHKFTQSIPCPIVAQLILEEKTIMSFLACTKWALKKSYQFAQTFTFHLSPFTFHFCAK